MIQQYHHTFATPGRGMINLSSDLSAYIHQSGIQVGLCNLFIHHTSASLVISENTDPLVQEDLEGFMSQLVRDGDSHFKHTEEGPDDMSAHVRSVLTQTTLSIPITENKLALGTWQGVYLWEHRYKAYKRRVTITLIGE